MVPCHHYIVKVIWMAHIFYEISLILIGTWIYTLLSISLTFWTKISFHYIHNHKRHNKYQKWKFINDIVIDKKEQFCDRAAVFDDIVPGKSTRWRISNQAKNTSLILSTWNKIHFWYISEIKFSLLKFSHRTASVRARTVWRHDILYVL